MLRSSFALGASLVALASAASAADLPRRSAAVAPAPYYAAAPVFSWTGFYAGVNAGADFRSSPATSVAAQGFAPTAYQGSSKGGSTGFTGGFQAGYNYQMNSLVVGLEADLEYVGRRGVNGAVVPAAPGTNYFAYAPVSGGSNWIGTVRPRVGYAVDRTLLYVTGGLAFGSVNSGGSVSYVGTGAPGAPVTAVYGATSSSSTKVGYALGAGGEYAITPNVIARVEYLYASLGSKGQSYLAAANPGTSFSNSYRTNVSLLRGGVSYKF